VNVISLVWLLNIILATDNITRPHGANPETIKSFYDREVNNINWAFGVITGTATTLAAGVLAALLARLAPGSTESSIANESGTTTTTVFIEKAARFGEVELILSILLVGLLVGVMLALVGNRVAHLRLRRSAANVVAWYAPLPYLGEARAVSVGSCRLPRTRLSRIPFLVSLFHPLC